MNQLKQPTTLTISFRWWAYNKNSKSKVMKNLIQLPSDNVYEEKSQEFFNSKLAKRLQDKYTPKPFEETYKPVYWIALIASYCCNLFSILTASTFVFSYLLSIFLELPEPIVWASLFTGILLVGIESLQRLLTPQFFKGLLQYGFKFNSLVMVTIIVTLSLASIFFSYSGGFDVVKKLLSPPTYQTPILIDIEGIKAEYKNLVFEAGKDAESYKASKLYLGRLSDIHAKAYKGLLDKKASLQAAMITKINEAEAKNEALLTEAKEKHEEALKVHEESLQVKGGGLASFAIIAQILFFISIFFMEFFDYKTASQYALMGSPSGDRRKPKKVVKIKASKTPIPEVIKSPIIRQQIGFKTNTPKQAENKLKQGKTHIKTVVIDNTKTIEHNGKHYTMDGVNNFIRIYQKRVNEAHTKGDLNLVKSREDTLQYWNGRKEELLNKMK